MSHKVVIVRNVNNTTIASPFVEGTQPTNIGSKRMRPSQLTQDVDSDEQDLYLNTPSSSTKRQKLNPSATQS